MPSTVNLCSDLFNERTTLARRLKTAMDRWNESLAASVAGRDYPEGTVNPGEPKPQFWMDVEAYRPYFDQWKKRPEYQSRFKPRRRKP